MKRRLALYAILFCVIGFVGVASAYVHSTRVRYYGSSLQACGNLSGLPRLLQAAHFLPDQGDCVLGSNGRGGPLRCDNSHDCDAKVLSNGAIIDLGPHSGNCRLVGKTCQCIPKDKP